MITGLPLYCLMTVATRREVRYKYDINGNNFDDCWKATFFPCCALVQEENEILWRKRRASVLADPGYGRTNEKMEYKNAA
jgi:hypothetical protein